MKYANQTQMLGIMLSRSARIKTMRLFIVSLMLVPMLLLSACNKQVDPIGGKVRTGHVTHAIISLSPNVSEMLALAGVSSQMLVGRTASCNFPPDFAAVPVVMAGVKPDYEQIAGIHADVIAYDASLFSDEDIAKIKALNIKTLEFNATNMDEWSRFMSAIGKEIGNELHASQATDRSFGAYHAMLASGQKNAGKSIAVIIGDPSTGYRLVGQKSFLGNALSQAELKVVGGDSADFAPANLEMLIQADPDFIVTTKKSQAAILADPHLQSLSALKAKRVLDIEDDILLRVGGRLELLFNGLSAGIDAMSKMN